MGMLYLCTAVFTHIGTSVSFRDVPYNENMLSVCPSSPPTHKLLCHKQKFSWSEYNVAIVAVNKR